LTLRKSLTAGLLTSVCFAFINLILGWALQYLWNYTINGWDYFLGGLALFFALVLTVVIIAGLFPSEKPK